MSVERRHARRVEGVFSIRYGGYEGFALNFCSQGVRIVTDSELPVEELDIELTVEPGLTVELRGVPVWQQRITPRGRHVVGIHFVGDQESQQARLERWIRNRAA